MSYLKTKRILLCDVLAIDPSLTKTAAVVAPLNWLGDWNLLTAITVGCSLKRTSSDFEKINRCLQISDAVTAHGRCCSSAWIEGYAYSQATGAYSLGELGGTLRADLTRAGVEVHVAPISSARKLLGKVPRKNPKPAVQSILKSFGCQETDHDICDAIVILNFAMCQLGGFYYSSNK